MKTVNRLVTQRRTFVVAFLLVALSTLLLSGTALAGQFENGEIYRLEAGQTIDDDLYVSAEEVFIDGTVDGDLIAAGGYIEINGTVTGDVILAGVGIKIAGTVGDDARLVGVGIDLAGSIGDDLIMAGVGQPGGFSIPMQVGNRTVVQGIRLLDANRVGGDTVIFGGSADISGRIDGDLVATVGEVNLNARVGGDANLNASALTVTNNSQIEGTLTYSATSEQDLPGDVAGRIDFEPIVQAQANPFLSIIGWILRTFAVLVGFTLLGWLFLRFAPNALTKPVAVIDANPVEAGLWGLLVFALFMALPFASAFIVFGIVLLWGWGPGIVVFLLLFGVLGSIWLFSPLITGLWLGRKVAGSVSGLSGDLPMLLVGVLILVLLGRIPCLGWLVALFSFLMAMGGIAQSLRGNRGDTGSAPLPLPHKNPAPAADPLAALADITPTPAEKELNQG